MKPTDEELMAYADGELSENRRSEIAAIASDDPELLKIIEQHKAMRAATQAAFSQSDDALLSDGLAALTNRMRNDLISERAGNGQGASETRRQILWPLAAAATFVMGLMGSQIIPTSQSENPIILVQQNGHSVAGQWLAAALTSLPVHSERITASGTFSVDASFVAADGQYCRQFLIRSEKQTGGIACLQDDLWQVITLATRPEAPSAEYQTAGAEADPLAATAILLGVEKKLSPGEEAELIEQGWK